MNSHISDKKIKLHYGWIIVMTGTAVVFSCIGLGRFSLGMLLPSMSVSLDLNYSQMGLISTGNFAGYMISIIFAGIIAKAVGARWTIAIGLIMVGGSMMFISRTSGFNQVLLLFTVTGMGSGLANVPMMGLVSHWFKKTTRGRAAGFMISGNGLAIAFAGVYIPWINTSLGSNGWRAAWLTLGGISILIALVAAVLLRNSPEEKGIEPLGTNNESMITESVESESVKSTRWTMVHLGSIYMFFGATYAVYVTFIVTSMINERGFGEGAAGRFWAIVGVLSIFSGPLFGWMSDKLGRKVTLMMVYGLLSIAYALAAATLSNIFIFASIVIFGLAVWSIPTIMTAAVGDYMGPAKAVSAFGFITLFFGAGQITGPVAAGFLADITGSFGTAFWMCALLAIIAIVVSKFLKDPSLKKIK